jgi:hypothetical protein
LEASSTLARKYKVGLVIAHQNLDQFEPRLRATVMASTSIKLAGGLSAKDASAFARKMYCEPEFLQSMRKYPGHTEFACFVRNVTPTLLRLTVPFGQMEGKPKLSAEAQEALLARNRQRYCSGRMSRPQDMLLRRKGVLVSQPRICYKLIIVAA